MQQQYTPTIVNISWYLCSYEMAPALCCLNGVMTSPGESSRQQQWRKYTPRIAIIIYVCLFCSNVLCNLSISISVFVDISGTLLESFTLSMHCLFRFVQYIQITIHGPLSRYVKLRVAHAPGMPGTFSPRPTSKETSRHASRHVRHARAVMHVGIAYPWSLGKLSRHSCICATAILHIWQEAHAVDVLFGLFIRV